MTEGSVGEGDRHEIERLLRRQPAPAARPGFRAGLRGAFLAAGADEGGKSASRAVEGFRNPVAVQDEFERLLARSPAPAARPAFREELRGAFVAGALQPRGPALRAVPARPAGRWMRIVAPLVAAAAIVLVAILLPPEPSWRVVDVQGGDPLTVSGVALAPSQVDRLGVELSSGCELASGTDLLDLTLADTLRMRVHPGTELKLAALPPLGTSEPLQVHLERGEVFLRTLEGYPGNPILVRTPESDVHVTGTTLGVRVDHTGTCVCVADGAVIVDHGVDSTPVRQRVEARTSYVVYRDPGSGPPSALVPFDPPGDPAHAAHTQALVEYLR